MNHCKLFRSYFISAYSIAHQEVQISYTYGKGSNFSNKYAYQKNRSLCLSAFIFLYPT